MSSLLDYDNDLPGVITEIEAEYSQDYDTSQFGTTDSMIIIGTAFNGPTGQLTPIYSPEHAAYIFGKTYDSEKDQETTLVANVQDAWDRGCRTIYCLRVGGKELYKDFDFCVDSNYKLRVSAMFPSNIGKQCYFKYDNTIGMESLRFYKPSERATIAEKKQGYVTSTSAVLSTEIRLNQDYGYNRDSNLVDVIKIFNGHSNNNVIKLSIIDHDGNDVTNSPATRSLPLGVLYPGVYFIGRDHSACSSITEQTFNIVSKTSGTKPFTDFSDPYYRSLIINSDVSQPLPIYAKNMAELYNILKEVDITMVEDWDFLDNTEVPDRAFVPNKEDYEQADISGFDLYKALGTGFAITAKAEKRVDSTGKELTPRVRETPMDDDNHTMPIIDGIYSMLQDAEIRYRVLTCASADETISGKLPRANDFKKAIPQSLLVLKNYIKLTPIVDEANRSISKAYTIQFSDIENATVDNIEDIYSKEVFPVIGSIDKIEDIETATLDNGTLLMLLDAEDDSNNVLIRINDDSTYSFLNGTNYENKYFIVDQNLYVGMKVTDETYGEYIAFKKVKNPATEVENKEYILGDMLNHVFVYQIQSADEKGQTLKPLGNLKTMISEEDQPLIIYAESLDFTVNEVIIKSIMFDNITLEELVNTLNENEIFNQIFKAELTNDGSEFKDDFISDILADETRDGGQIYNLPKDRIISYDYDMYIPYRTVDNFARQLAQHCTYTELKTGPTHGFIGCERMTNLDLSNTSKKVSNINDINFDLYAKTYYGRNILDKNNNPYPIGRNISIVFGQHPVVISTDGYYEYTSNSAAGYAGMVSTLPLDQSSTNQPINFSSTSPNLTQSQLGQLTAKGIVTFRRSFTKGIVVTDGVTMAPAESVFRRLSASRITGAVEDLIRQACEPFIGKQNHDANRNALYTAIDSKLSSIKGTLIEQYKFKLMYDQNSAKLGYIDINYDIVPIYEIRNIRNKIRVVDSISS